ncbi:MAG: hypothetical protein ACJ747_01345 [Gaiellaceae bacterium]
MRSAAVLTGLALALAGATTEAALGDVLPPVPTVPTPTVPTPVPVPTVPTPVPVPKLPAPTVPSTTTPSTPASPVHVSTPSVGVSPPTAQQPVPSVSVGGRPAVGGSSAVGGATVGASGGAGASGPSGGGSSASGSAGSTGTGYGAASGSRAGAHSIAITRLRVSRPWLSTTGPAAHRTTTLNFHLRTRARVIFTVTQIAPECRLAGHFVFNGRAGFNKVAFSGRIGGRPLAPGTYRISARVPGGTTLLRVVVVIVDTAPSPTELDRARHADVCAAARLLAANATLASGGAAGSTGSGASQHPGATSEIVRNQTAAASTRTSSHTSSSKNGGHATAAPFTPARVSGNATNPLVILALATAVVLLGLAALPQRAIPDPRLTHVLAQHRLEVAFAGAGALAAALVALALA